MTGSRAIGWMLCLCVVASACASVRTRRTDLRDAIHSYNVAIRWGHIQKASMYIPAAKRANFVARKRAALAHMRIHEVHLRNVAVATDQSAAKVLLQVAFSVGADPIIRNHLVEQKWRFVDGQWLLISKRQVKKVRRDASSPSDLY
ncbi:MAG TPA: hypothetical protein DCQ06_14815 [Myxococcales bacterium]|nr:hypothetical protein [Myxococcales bacterium]HAN32864.1 hypothetical protein [Myxococcales bacterium]